mgnify:CR=1 FL=1
MKLDFAGGSGANGAVDGQKYLLFCSDPTVAFDTTEYVVNGDGDQSHEFKAPAGAGRIEIDVALAGAPAAGGNTVISSFVAMRQAAAPAPTPPAGNQPAGPSSGISLATNGALGSGAAVTFICLALAFIIGTPVVFGIVMGIIGMTSEKPTTVDFGELLLGGDEVVSEGLDIHMEATVDVEADKLIKADDAGSLLGRAKAAWTTAIAPKCADGSTVDPATSLCADGSPPVP